MQMPPCRLLDKNRHISVPCLNEIRGCNLRPAGINTVLPSSEPLYFLSTCSAVTPASGRDAASLKERFFGFRAT